MRKIPGPLSSNSNSVREFDREKDTDFPSARVSDPLLHMETWIKLCKIVGVDTSDPISMQNSLAEVMPCTIQYILTSDELRVSRLMAVVRDASQSHTGVWIISLIDSSGCIIEAFVDSNTLTEHGGVIQCGAAILIEGAALFVEHSTLKRYIVLHTSSISAVVVDDVGTKNISLQYEEYEGI